MYEEMKFLHCMKSLSFLEGTLTKGFMFTDHRVYFDPFHGLAEEEQRRCWAETMPLSFSLLKSKLALYGIDFDCLDEQRKRIIFACLGTIQGDVPMLCFSEIPKGVTIKDHASRFGRYGVIMSKRWIEKNHGDRVVYVGQGSPLSKKIIRSLDALRAQSVFVGKNGNVLLDRTMMELSLDLCTLVEVRTYALKVREWRIAGRTGFMGGERDTGKRVAFDISECHNIFVDKEDEIEKIKECIETTLNTNNPMPQVTKFPELMPS